MSSSEELLEKLAGKITSLTERYKDLNASLNSSRDELANLREENSRLQSKIDEQSKSIIALNSELEEAKTSVVASDSNNEQLEERVNQLVNEIDECISLLKEG